jgi:hypothetical protein
MKSTFFILSVLRPRLSDALEPACELFKLRGRASQNVDLLPEEKAGLSAKPEQAELQLGVWTLAHAAPFQEFHACALS